MTTNFIGLRHRLLAVTLLGSASAVVFCAPSYAADAATDAKIKALEAQVQALSQAIQELKQSEAAAEAQAASAQTKAADAQTQVAAAQKAAAAQTDIAAQVADLKRSTATEYADLQKQKANDVKVTLNNARPTFATPDGQFSFSLKAIVQFDSAYYSQPHMSGASPPTDLSSGTNFRRARFGFEGKAFGDWAYSFLYDMGGTAGTEASRLSDAYIEYNGLAPFHFRTGAYASPQGLEDQTGTGDLIFLEKAAPADLARGIAGADGRENFFGVIANGSDYYAALSWTGRKPAAAATFDQQMALVGRAAYRVYKDTDSNVALSGGGSYVFKVADTSASPTSISPVTLAVVPENYVDATTLIGTPAATSATVLGSAINGNSIVVWNLEAGANWNNFYAQGGYFGYSVGRVVSAPVLPNPNFDGWYGEATWIITGESRRYSEATATWGAPQPSHPLGLNSSGWGAWELAARYDVTDLDYNAGIVGAAAPAGGIRGGEQDGWTFGINWYPINNVRFLFDYQNENINRIATTTPFKQIGQTVNVFSTRAQLTF